MFAMTSIQSTGFWMLALWWCLSAVPVAADEPATIKRLTQEWIDASARGDIETYFSFVTDDFAWIGDSSGSGYIGREEVQAFVQPFFETTSFSLRDWTSDELLFSGDGKRAVHIWSGQVVTGDKDSGRRVAIDRTYIDFWAKQADGVWLCTRHTFVVLGVKNL